MITEQINMEENKKFKAEDFEGQCICDKCPSYVDCKEFLFCFRGKSKCIVKNRGCLCGACPVHKKAGFKKGFYCMRGNEEEQTK